MTDIQHTTRKADPKFMFEVQLNWLNAQKGILTAEDVKGSLYVGTPHVFGGEGQEWSPEHLFLSSVSSCFMSTFLVFARKLGFEISHFMCNAIGQVELVNGKYCFTQINVFPKIYVASEDLREKASTAIQKTQQYCLISNSISAEIIYHPELLIDEHPKLAVV
jgi:peroxiredoxin-like protein